MTKEQTTVTPADLDRDPDEVRLLDLVAWAHREADALAAVIPSACDAQWSAAPVARPRDDTAERAKGAPTDPTSEIVACPMRLDLREQMIRSGHLLRSAIVALRGVRRGIEIRLADWEGDTVGG